MKNATRLINYLLALGLGISTIGCREIKKEYSDVLHEDGKVADVVYTPSRHGSGVSPQINDLLSDDGPTFGIQVTNIDIPEVYAVVFKCQHGKFIIEGTTKRYRDLWEKLSEDQEVDITFRELYKSVYEDIDKDGQRDLVSRTLIKYDFIDAQPKKQQ